MTMEWNEIGEGNAHVSDGACGFWATFRRGTTARDVLEAYLATADYESATGQFRVVATIGEDTASAAVGPGGIREDE